MQPTREKNMRELKKLKEPDWKGIINKIQLRGYTQIEIEAETGVPQGMVSKMKRGNYKHPSYIVGSAIMKMYEGGL